MLTLILVILPTCNKQNLNTYGHPNFENSEYTSIDAPILNIKISYAQS